jgi:hypothetical protein
MPSGQAVSEVAAELRDLLKCSANQLACQPARSSISFTMQDFTSRYPALAEAAEHVVVMRATPWGAEMKTLAQEYERMGKPLLSPEEMERELAERRGAA